MSGFPGFLAASLLDERFFYTAPNDGKKRLRDEPKERLRWRLYFWLLYRVVVLFTQKPLSILDFKSPC